MPNENNSKLKPINIKWARLLLIVFLTISISKSEIFKDNPMIMFLIALVILTLTYILTKGIKQRCIWWVALAPLHACGFFIYNIYLSTIDILSLTIIIEYFLNKSISGNLPLRHMPYVVVISISFLFSVLISLIFSPLSPTFGPFLRFSLTIGTFLVAYLSFEKNIDSLAVMKAIGYQLVVYYFILISDTFLVIHQERNLMEWLGLVGEAPRLVFSNVLAYYAVISLPFVIFFKSKWTRWILILSAIILLPLTLSRSAFVAIIIDILLLIYFLAKKKRFYWTFCGLIVLGLLTISVIYVDYIYIEPFRETSKVERFAAAQSHIEAFIEHPITGGGFGQWIRIYELGIPGITIEDERYKLGTVSYNPHNTFIRMASDTGLIGLLMFLILLGFFTSKLYKAKININKPRFYMFEKGKISLTLAFASQLVLFMFGDYVEVQTFWCLLLAIAVFSKEVKKYNYLMHMAATRSNV